ncbi:MAG: acyl-CoA dehydrogenase [Streptosporangiaceae bacterium]|jgi:alkylation response protein AidB-like acyl-CoA dehydrogenase
MTLGLTEEHHHLAETIRNWAQRNCPPEAVRAAADGPDSGSARYLESFAPSLAEQGVLGLHLPDEDGGQGYGLPELAVGLEELGRALVPGAFLPTVFASAVLAASGVTGKLVVGLADGSRTGAVCLASGVTGGAGGDGGLIIDGAAAPVLGASLADLVILPVHAGHGEIWAAVDAGSLEITALDSLDLTRPVGRVRAAGVTVPADRLLTGLDRSAVTSLAAILFGAEASGIAGWAVHHAAEYAKIRQQFGRPIGQFQAVKHRCAWMLTAAELASAAVWDAARTEQDAAPSAAGAAAALGAAAPRAAAARDQPAPGRQREFAASVAAVLAVDAAVSCVNDCIQVLGGIGYTWDHEAQLYYRRALSLRALLGSSVSWAERVAGLALAGVRRPVQVELPGGDAPLRARLAGELAGIAALAGRERAQRLVDGGWVTPHLPRPWGRGADALEQVIIDQEMHAAGVKAPSLLIGAWVVPALIQYGTPQQQDRFLPPTLRGEIIWCQLFSEPGAGSDLAGLTTRAVRADGGWRLTGQKIWTSLAKQAAWAICIARTDPAALRHDGITYFLVDMSDPGVDVRPLREITGESFFNQVFLDDVFVPDDRVVGEVNGGWRVARTTLANERVSLSRSWAFGSGVAELLEQVQAGSQAPAGQIGRLVAEGHAIDLLGTQVTMKRLSGTEPGATGSVRKLLGMRHAQQAAELCWAMSGADGALGAGPEAAFRQPDGPNGPHWARQVLTTRALTIGGGTTDIQLNIISERILGLPRDPDPPAA